ncbi:ElyC/SanA/YdcF family protein [Corallincola platygyrae]
MGEIQIASREQQIEAVDVLPEETKYIVVLGCGHHGLPASKLSSQLYECGLKRLTEAMRHYHQDTKRILVFTGWGGNNYVASALVMRDTAIMLGLDPNNALALTTPKDTYEEAVVTAGIVKDSTFALVTSASHLPRAVSLFDQVGLQPIPVPADIRGNPDFDYDWWSYRPDSNQLDKSTKAWYAYIGELWVKIGGK